MLETTIRTVCPHDCPDQCSIIATVEGGRLLRVAGDPEHPFTRGFLCGKVNRYEERVYSPERLLTPLRRSGRKGSGEFSPISWNEALDEIVERWRALIAEFGGETLLGYAYSGTVGLVNRNAVRALFHALGASRLIAGTVCDSTSEAGWSYAVGETPGTDPETIADSDLVVCWSANIVTTNVHLLPFIDDARAKGAQLIVIDPLRTRTARRADWHIAPRIGTDSALALGIMHVLVRDGLIDAEYIAARTSGFERLRDEALPAYDPATVEQITGVPAADIERLAHLYGEARAPFIRVGMGMSRNNGGGMAIRAVACLPAIVGAWQQPGGGAMMETIPVYGLNYDAVRRPDLMKQPTRQINHSTLGEALLELQEPPIRALFIAANNPAVTCPDQARTIAGLSRDDLFTVVHDSFLTDTARYADIVLPACTGFETEDFFRSYGTYYMQYAPRVIEPLGESRPNVWVAQQLAQRLGLSDPTFRRDPRQHMSAMLDGASGGVADYSLDDLLTGAPLKVRHEGRGPEQTYFYSEAMVRDGLPPLPGWEPDPAEESAARWPLRLLTAPGHSQHHSAFAGVERLQRRQGEPRCLLHPLDAAPRGIGDGDAVLLRNDNGELGLRAAVSADTLPGVVVVEANRARGRYLRGGPLNVLTSGRLADMGGGATYQSTWVEASPLDAG